VDVYNNAHRIQYNKTTNSALDTDLYNDLLTTLVHSIPSVAAMGYLGGDSRFKPPNESAPVTKT